MKKWMMIPALAGAVVLGGVTMVANADKSDKRIPDGYVTVEEAETKAVETVGGVVTEIELDREVSGDKYEVEVKSEGIEYDLDIDAKTGEVLRTKQDDEKTRATSKKSSSIDKPSVSSKNLLTMEEAIAIAMKKAKGVVTEAEFDKDDHRPHYEIEIEDSAYEYEFEIDAYTGAILEFEKDRKDDDVKKASTPAKKSPTVEKSEAVKPAAPNKKIITVDQAIAIAMNKAKGIVTEAELDDDDGRLYYDIEIEDGTYEYEFEIDAITGEILDFEKDRDDD